MWEISPNAVKPELAIAWFRSRLLVSADELASLTDEARATAFFVARLARLDLLQAMFDALDSALANGDSFQEFKAALPQTLSKSFGANRLRTIFDTNLQRSYGAGRYAEASSTEAERPYWGLEVVLDGRTSPICSALRGTILPAEELRRRGWIPPLHFRCRTALVTYSAEQAQSLGITQNAADVRAQLGFGQPPGAPNEWHPRGEDYDPELWARSQLAP